MRIDRSLKITGRREMSHVAYSYFTSLETLQTSGNVSGGILQILLYQVLSLSVFVQTFHTSKCKT